MRVEMMLLFASVRFYATCLFCYYAFTNAPDHPSPPPPPSFPPPSFTQRDLALNWNVDVAKELEEYLEDLEGISISFDGGKTSLNFAEAAILIQGSAVVYSRKVEYLYSLIYQALDVLSSKSK